MPPLLLLLLHIRQFSIHIHHAVWVNLCKLSCRNKLGLRRELRLCLLLHELRLRLLLHELRLRLLLWCKLLILNLLLWLMAILRLPRTCTVVVDNHFHGHTAFHITQDLCRYGTIQSNDGSISLRTICVCVFALMDIQTDTFHTFVCEDTTIDAADDRFDDDIANQISCRLRRRQQCDVVDTQRCVMTSGCNEVRVPIISTVGTVIQ